MAKVWLRLIVISLFVSPLHAVSIATEDELLRDVIGKHWQAMGGLWNWSKIESMQLSGTIERDGELFDICIVKKRPDQIRATVTVPASDSEEVELQFIQAYDGDLAWTATRVAGTEEMLNQAIADGTTRESLSSDAGVMPKLLKLDRAGAQLTILGTSLIDESQALRIQAEVSSTNLVYTFYLDMKNHQLVKMEKDDPRSGVTTVTYKDYHEVSGILIAKNIVIDSELTGKSVMTTDSIRVGVGIYDDYFEVPTRLLETADL